ncbi:MAG: hypothetical protein QXE79_02015 [Candidatus Bathyarchaeia archaeon]
MKAKIRLQVEYENLKESFEGDVDEVFKALTQFLYRVYPNIEVASRLIWTPDLNRLMEKIPEYCRLTTEGDFILVKPLPSTEQSILLILTLAYLSHKLGKRSDEFIESQEISKTINKAEKTVRNTLTELTKTNTVERIDKGRYKITSYGLRKVEEIMMTG